MAKFKIGDKVRSKDYPDAGMMTITQIGQDVHGTTYRTKWENGSVPSQVFYDSTLVAANSVPVSTNPVVQNALNATRLAGPHEIVERVDPAARNADESTKVKVVVYVDTLFGGKHMEGTMTIGQLRAAFAKIGHARLFADVERRFDNGKGGDVNVSLPCEVYFTKA